jgi:PAS domain S-box-containing protein
VAEARRFRSTHVTDGHSMTPNSALGCIRVAPPPAGITSLAFAAIPQFLRPAPGAIPALIPDTPECASRFAQNGSGPAPSDSSRQRLASIVESSDDAIIAKDLDGNITDWNAAAETLFGYTAAEIIGKSILLLIPEDLRAEETIILERIRDGRRIKHFETIRLHKNGSPVVVSLSISPIRDDTGSIIGASKIARDITDLRHSQEQQELLMREMNHRVKNLFAVVSSVVRLSARSALSASGLAQTVDERLISLARAHDLTMPRIEGGMITAQQASLRELAELSLAAYHEHAPNAKSRIVISGPEIRCGPTATTALALLFHEFATNSVKYGALSVEGGEVALHWQRGDKFNINWKETGGPLIMDTPKSNGFGNVMVQASVRTLGGRIEYDWALEGLSIAVNADPARLVH